MWLQHLCFPFKITYLHSFQVHGKLLVLDFLITLLWMICWSYSNLDEFLCCCLLLVFCVILAKLCYFASSFVRFPGNNPFKMIFSEFIEMLWRWLFTPCPQQKYILSCNYATSEGIYCIRRVKSSFLPSPFKYISTLLNSCIFDLQGCGSPKLKNLS